MKMNGKKHYLILYDIRNEKRLTKVAKILESYSIRVQYSVFESDMPELIMKQMKSRLEKVIDTTEDFLLIFDICEKDWQKRQLFGKIVCKEEKNEKFIFL